MGNWVEDLSAGASSSAPPVMSVHYSDQKAMASGAVKLRVINELVVVLSAFPGAASVLRGGSVLLPPGAITWSQVAEIHRLKFHNDERQGKYAKKDKSHKKDKKATKDAKHEKKAYKHEKPRAARTAPPPAGPGSGPALKRSRA